MPVNRNPTPAVPAPALRLLLLPLAPLYWLLTTLRPALYRWGWLTTHRVATPVISVGNLTVGGSGKSPLVDYLVREAARLHLRPAVATRGYGGRSRSHLMRVCLEHDAPEDPHLVGDEPCLLARRNPGVPVFVGRDRVAAARLAEVHDAPGLIVLDDGYQHLRLGRDLNVLLVDAERGLGNGRLLPLGLLREPSSAISRADVVLVTKAELGDAAGLARQLVGRHGSRAPVFTCDYRPARLLRLDGGAVLPPQALAGSRVSLVCAIAQPGGFARTVEGLGCQVAALRALRDHDPYGEAELSALEELAAGASAEKPEWLTTEKDAVKLRGRLPNPERMWVLEMEVVPEPAAAAFFFDFLSAIQLK